MNFKTQVNYLLEKNPLWIWGSGKNETFVLYELVYIDCD